MYTPGTIIDLTKNDDIKYGLVLESNETFVKYLELSPFMNRDTNKQGVYTLIGDRFLLSYDKFSTLYVQLGVICIADGEFRIVGKMKDKRSFEDVLNYFENYRSYEAQMRENNNNQKLENFTNNDISILSKHL